MFENVRNVKNLEICLLQKPSRKQSTAAIAAAATRRSHRGYRTGQLSGANWSETLWAFFSLPFSPHLVHAGDTGKIGFIFSGNYNSMKVNY